MISVSKRANNNYCFMKEKVPLWGKHKLLQPQKKAQLFKEVFKNQFHLKNRNLLRKELLAGWTLKLFSLRQYDELNLCLTLHILILLNSNLMSLNSIYIKRVQRKYRVSFFSIFALSITINLSNVHWSLKQFVEK